jgi:hypothetical protein
MTKTVMDDTTFNHLESRYHFFVWVSWLALPAAGFIYGFLAYPQEILGNTHPIPGADSPLMEKLFSLALLVILFAIAARVLYGLKVRGHIFSRYTKAFSASEAADDPKEIINAKSVLLSQACFSRFTRFAKGSYGKSRVFIGELSVGYFDTSKFTQSDSAIEADYMVFIIQLDANFPHIFVDGHSQNFLTPKYRNLWTLRWKLKNADKSQKLEGDFPRHFDVYAPSNQQIETLSILTPDVMQVMKDLGRGFDYEIVDTQLYIIAEPNVLRLRKAYETIQAVTASLDELLYQLRRPKGEISQHYLRTGLGKIAIFSIAYYYIALGLGILLPTALPVIGMVPGALLRLIAGSFL